jgi:uncharacterized protein (DUF58 family)
VNLTPFAVVALVAAALLGIVGTWSDALGEFPWWRLVVALLVIGLIYEFLAVRSRTVAAAWRSAGRLFLGRVETLELELGNLSARALTLRTLPVLPGGVAEASEAGARAQATVSADGPPVEARELRLPPSGRIRTGVAVRPIELGAHAWPMLPVRVLGPLGLAWWSRRVATDAESTVLPDTLGRRAAITGSAEAGAAPQSRLGGGHELHQLREYRSGDPRHTIDWKASARASRLITRVFSEDQHLEIMILLDAGRTSRTEFDGMSQLGHYVNLAARFAEYCAAGDDRVGLVVFADRPLRVVPPGRGGSGVVQIRRALAGLTPQSIESDALEAGLRVRRLVRHRCLAIVLTDLYESSSTGRLAQTAKLLAPKHLPLMIGLLGDEVATLADGEARDWLDPYRSLAARAYARQVRANIAHLGELGALAMTARPEELDRKVLGQYRLLRAQHRI